MNKIIINPHYCNREEYQELKDYLTKKTWDWQEISKGKIIKIRCNNCMWEGNEDDLIRGEDEKGTFDGCPNCNTDQYLMNLEN